MTSAPNISSVRGTRAASHAASLPAGLDGPCATCWRTYPAFVALVVALVVAGKTGGLGATGAWIWLAARVIYFPIYATGVPVVRTLVWLVSIAGLLLMLIPLVF